MDLLGAALVVALVAGPACGFVVGRATGSDGDVDIEAQPQPGDAPQGPEVLGGPVPTGPDGSPIPPPIPFPSSGPICPGSSGGFLTTGDEGGSAVRCDPMDSVFRRDAGAVKIRAYSTSQQTPMPICPVPVGCPPPECFPTRYVAAGLSTEDVAGGAGGPLYGRQFDPILFSNGLIGVAEGAPIAWAVVQVDAGVATVRARFADGGEDAMEPVDGVAVLASPVAPAGEGSAPFGGSIEALDDSGGVVASSDLVTGTPAPQSVATRPDCAPVPPALPEPNGPPPEDEEAARQAVIDAYEVVYSTSSTDAERAENVDDAHGLAGTFEVAAEAFPEALEVVSVRVDEVRFLNQTEAALYYDIVLPGYMIPEFPNRIGRAVLVDGKWKVSRATICGDLALAAATCPP